MADNNTSLTTWNIQRLNTGSRFAQYWLQDWLPTLPLDKRQTLFLDLFKHQIYDVYWYGERIPFLEALKRQHDGLYNEAWNLLMTEGHFRLWLCNINMALRDDFRSVAASIQNLEISVSSLSIKDVRQVFSGGASFPCVNLVFSSSFEKLEESLLPWIFLVLNLSPKLQTLHLTWPHYLTRNKKWPQLPEYYDTYLPAYERATREGLSPPKPPLNLLLHIEHAFLDTSIGATSGTGFLPSRPSWSYWDPHDTTGVSKFPHQPYTEPDYKAMKFTWRLKDGKVLVWNVDEPESESESESD